MFYNQHLCFFAVFLETFRRISVPCSSSQGMQGENYSILNTHIRLFHQNKEIGTTSQLISFGIVEEEVYHPSLAK